MPFWKDLMNWRKIFMRKPSVTTTENSDKSGPIEFHEVEVIPLGVITSELTEDEIVEALDVLPLYKKKKKILSVLNVFETGKINGDYSNISIFRDGPKNIKQLTYGRSQTTQHSHLSKLMDNYIAADGLYSDYFKQFNFKDYNLVYNESLIKKMRIAGNDPIMRLEQDKLFEKQYWVPAHKWARDNGFTLPLSMLVIYDSFIHSGGIPSWLRNRFREVPPAKGGDEKAWIEKYTDVRHNWLGYHSRKILRKTIYRTNTFKRQFDKNNWDLESPIIANGVTIP